MKQKTNFNAQLHYLNSLRRFEKIKLGLDRMRSLMSALDNPQENFTSLHIAGTNGKGSTAAFLASILQTTLYSLPTKIGLYTSPYLRNFNERIAVNGQPISDADLAHLIAKVRGIAAQHNLDPTYFEFATALAFLHFAEQKVDCAVIEVGLGGDLDATNIISPAISIITNIGHDHERFLGQDKLTIASHKAGIIKPNIPVVTAETDINILNYFSNICRQKNAPLHIVQRELPSKILAQTLDGQTFSTAGTINDTFKIKMLGTHQVLNATTALLSTLVLSGEQVFSGVGVPVRRSFSEGGGARTPLHQALAQTKWPGRLDIISRDPFILLDGAHNPEGITSLRNFISSKICPAPGVLVIGIKADKDAAAMLKQIVPHFPHVICTQANFDPLPAAQLARHTKAALSSLKSSPPYQGGAGGGQIVQTIPNLKQALNTARRQLPPNQMLLVTGSLYLVGDTLKLISSR